MRGAFEKKQIRIVNMRIHERLMMSVTIFAAGCGPEETWEHKCTPESIALHLPDSFSGTAPPRTERERQTELCIGEADRKESLKCVDELSYRGDSCMLQFAHAAAGHRTG